MKAKTRFYREMEGKIKSVESSGTSNSLGTALYVALERTKDEFVQRYGSEEVLEGLQESEKPERGYLVGWFSKHIAEGKAPFHAGVVTHVNPLQVAERRRAQGDFSKSASFDEVDSSIRNSEEYLKTMDVKYFVPSKLQKILDREGELK